MTKKHFIALAEAIMQHNDYHGERFTDSQLETLANFCAEQNSQFMRDRWLGYIHGENGPNGGAR